MPRKLIRFLDSKNLYVCQACGTHLTTLSDLISKNFRAKSGKAYLFNDVTNIRVGQTYSTSLSTGKHDIADIYCNVCKEQRSIGWKYIFAENQSQKYKVDKFILEVAFIEKEDWIDGNESEEDNLSNF